MGTTTLTLGCWVIESPSYPDAAGTRPATGVGAGSNGPPGRRRSARPGPPPPVVPRVPPGRRPPRTGTGRPPRRPNASCSASRVSQSATSPAAPSRRAKRSWWSSTCSPRAGSRGTTMGRWPCRRASRMVAGPPWQTTRSASTIACCSASWPRNGTAPGSWRRAGVPVLHGQPDRAGGLRVPLRQPVDEPVEGVLVGADRDQQPELGRRRAVALARQPGRLDGRPGCGRRAVPVSPRHSSVPTTVASGYCRRCSSHCTSIADRNGRQSRAVSVGVSIRSYTSM